MAAMKPDAQRELIMAFGTDPVLAHATLFARNHSDPTPRFHKEMIRDWHSNEPNVLTMAFRGAAKSTLAEEAITIEVGLKRTRNCLILGESETRAAERLKAVKNHFEQNEYIQTVFDVGPGPIWTDTRIELSNGVMIQALGRNQSLRGVKHLDARPDLLFGDDLEDKESVATPEARRKTLSWFTSTVMPAMDPKHRMRIAATPLNRDALAPTLSRSPAWLAKVYPVIYKDASGAWVALWPERFSVEWAQRMQADMIALGQSEDFTQEYLCQAEDLASKTFTADMIRVVPRPRSWQATYAIYDPARTTNKQSATTGKVVCSWIGRKLVVWEASAKKWMPDEIVGDMFNVDARYNPVAVGVEDTGLNEWLLQPIRSAQVARGVTLPLRPLHAPKGKLDFIRGLQPYFRAGEVEFATDLPDLRDQLLGFPTGNIDAPNALAYALKLKLGLPVYENFRVEMIVSDQKPARAPLWLALNSDGRITTAVLVQMHQGRLLVLADWLYEAEPGVALPDIVMDASLETPARGTVRGKAGLVGVARDRLQLCAPRPHFEGYSTIGLVGAVRKLPATAQRGGDILSGRDELRALMRRITHGEPALVVDERARWTLRALLGGFARDVDQQEPQANAYRVLMEGLEAFAGLLRGAVVGPDDNEGRVAYTADGRAYRSARG